MRRLKTAPKPRQIAQPTPSERGGELLALFHPWGLPMAFVKLSCRAGAREIRRAARVSEVKRVNPKEDIMNSRQHPIVLGAPAHRVVRAHTQPLQVTQAIEMHEKGGYRPQQ